MTPRFWSALSCFRRAFPVRFWHWPNEVDTHYVPRLISIEETRRAFKNPRLREPYGHNEEDAERWCQDLATRGLMVSNLPEIGSVCRDPNDDHVIAAAIAANAAFIVTGDADLLDVQAYEGIRIVAARGLIDTITDSSP